MRRWTIALLLVCATTARAGERLPSLPVETLAGASLVVPGAWPSQPVLLVVGFSRDARDTCRAWSERLRGTDRPEGAAVYQVAVIDDVPGLLRGLVARGIRKGVPPALHERFLLVTEQGQAWRKLAGYTQPDAAYLLLFDAQHALRWHASGSPDDARYRALRTALEQLTNPP
jgi:hypothetical protein